MNIAIVGLGLIGGSMAKSIKAKTAHAVYGSHLPHRRHPLGGGARG